MKLVSLPDNKFVHEHLTLGKEYKFEVFSSNGVTITMNNGEKCIMLRSRLSD